MTTSITPRPMRIYRAVRRRRPLRAPFPWFGGKSMVADLIWSYFGADVANYIEPFAGSLAVLLARPERVSEDGITVEPFRYETVNDIDANLANFWRSIAADPDAVARHADQPVHEIDLHSRHAWLIRTSDERRERMRDDPDYYDAKAAGWWCWGACLWIGGGWCSERVVLQNGTTENRRPCQRRANGTFVEDGKDCGVVRINTTGATICPRPQLSSTPSLITSQRVPYVDHGGRGIVSESRKLHRGLAPTGGQKLIAHHQGLLAQRSFDAIAERGIKVFAPAGPAPALRTQRRRFSDSGKGVVTTRRRFKEKRSGIVAEHLVRTASDIGDPQMPSSQSVMDWLRALSARLRNVRSLCGDWTRAVTPAITTQLGITAVLLDPPYSHDVGRDCELYAQDHDVASSVREWAIANGHDPLFRIALCGYEGEHDMPDTWSCVAWASAGGYAGISSRPGARGKANRLRERIWFSPHCLKPQTTFVQGVLEL